jgi:cobalt-zinc-cadmium efflux system membrane fusion protein
VFQQARAEMETQRILMNALAQKLEVIGNDPAHRFKSDNISKSVSIVSPINGFVSKVNVKRRQIHIADGHAFRAGGPARHSFSAFNVFEKDLNSLSVGQHVVAYSNGEPGKKFQAEIILISKNLDQDRMAEVHCHFEKYNPALVPGMYINGEVSGQQQKCADCAGRGRSTLGKQVLRLSRTRAAVQFEMTEVTPGVINQGKQQIEAKGMTGGTRLVVKNAYALLMKIKNTEKEG